MKPVFNNRVWNAKSWTFRKLSTSSNLLTSSGGPSFNKSNLSGTGYTCTNSSLRCTSTTDFELSVNAEYSICKRALMIWKTSTTACKIGIVYGACEHRHKLTTTCRHVAYPRPSPQPGIHFLNRNTTKALVKGRIGFLRQCRCFGPHTISLNASYASTLSANFIPYSHFYNIFQFAFSVPMSFMSQ